MKMPRRKVTSYMVVPKPALKIFVGVMVLAVLAIGSGMTYTWYVGRHSVPAEPAEVLDSTTARPVIKAPAKPSANNPVGASVQSLSTPIKPGSEASITVKTTPEARCTITAKYNEVASKDPGLVPKTADEYGMVDWIWTVDESAPVGKWPVDVVCAYGKMSGMVRGDLEVKL